MKVWALVLSLNFIFVSLASASVWQSDKHWNESWQNKYSNWIATDVGPKFFKKLGSPFKELKIDCADAHYALIAYFSRMHGLHMVVNNGSFSNKTTSFDRIQNPDKRLAAFINRLSNSYGTESLAHRDSYPVGLRDIKPGDLFTYKVGTNGNYTRHAYIVKNINIDGTFDVMYSTQARRDAGQPLNRHKSFMFKKAPFNTGADKNHWGFRRAKNSGDSAVSQESLRLSDFSQYQLAFKLLKDKGFTNGKLAFFREVRRLNKSVNESPNRLAERNFQAVCHSVQDRVEAVQNGVDHSKKIGGRCMEYGDYDAYSTPSRDSGIMDDYRNYHADVQSVDQSKINSFNKNMFMYIFQKGDISLKQANSLLEACSVNTSIGRFDIGNFKKNLFGGRVSFHPNDNIHRRWGLVKGQKTRCEEFYGYPTN